MKKFLITDLARIIKAHEPSILRSRVSAEDGRVTRDPSSEAELLRRTDERRFFTGVSIDSRTTKAGDCFFAVCGENFNGAEFVSDAFAKGAVCAVVSKDIESEELAGKEILKVGDTVKALGNFAREYRRQFSSKVIAITGSVGKTTVRQIIYHVLSQHYRAHQAPKNFNNKIGLPLTLLGADSEHQVVIAELGSNYPGEIAYLTCIVQPDIAVVTNVYPAHLEGFGDLQAIKKEKLSIAEGLAKDGILIINADIAPDVVLLQGAQRRGNLSKVITFGKSDNSDLQAQNITFDGFSSRFTIDDTEIYLPLPGPGNIENALAAWAVCKQFGLTIHDFAQGLKTLPSISMRAEVLQIGTLTVINDCYNANPASMKNALNILTSLGLKEGRRLVFICGEMAELGNQSEQLHTELGADIAGARVQLLIAVGTLAEIAAAAAQKTADYNLQVKCFDNTLSACNNLQEFIKDNDIVLIKGSRIAKLEMVVEKLKDSNKKEFSHRANLSLF